MRLGHEKSVLWPAVLTAMALVAFATNSLLCRFALGEAQVDAASFTSLRLLSGALTLWVIALISGRYNGRGRAGSWGSAAMLFLYAVAFSFAYLTLDVGTGALILFGSVQATMIVAGFIEGHRPQALEWIGMICASCGLIYLVSPGLSAPAPFGSMLMAAAGIAWGIYSLRGRGSGDPVASTAGNFVRAAPFALLVSLILLADLDITARGACLAVLSGALASGMGYVVWYAALKDLTTTRAAIVQLAVPVLAASGGVLFLSEVVTDRLLVSGIVILGGVVLAIWGRDCALHVSPETSSSYRRVS
jgi:drug/metabolite transporter (DMT)-like permease